jgi:hypothetical protein
MITVKTAATPMISIGTRRSNDRGDDVVVVMAVVVVELVCELVTVVEVVLLVVVDCSRPFSGRVMSAPTFPCV